MGLLELLKDRLTPNVIEKISGFLGETPDDITVALNASLPTMFTGVELQAAKENGVNKIMDIIKEGGHTGDLLDDIPTLISNFDKTQLLVTIGSNIFNHFFGNNSNLLIEKVASLSGIRKTSASSLLGLSAPLVLGVYGKVVHRENLGISGLQTLIKEQHESIAKALPPSIAHILPQKTTPKTPDTTVEKKVNEDKTKTDKKAKDNQNQLGKIFPWLLLLLLALAAAYYLRSCRIKPNEESVALNTDSTEVAPITLPEDEPSNKEVTTNNEATASKNTEEKAAVPEEPATKTQTTQIKESASEKIEKPKTPTKRTNTEDNGNSSSSSAGFSSSSLAASSGNWISFSNNPFRSSNSAEVNTSSSEIRALANYLLQHPNASVTLSPLGSGRLATDRAYAIQGALYEQGIDISRVKVGSSRSGNGSVALRIQR